MGKWTMMEWRSSMVSEMSFSKPSSSFVVMRQRWALLAMVQRRAAEGDRRGSMKAELWRMEASRGKPCTLSLRRWAGPEPYLRRALGCSCGGWTFGEVMVVERPGEFPYGRRWVGPSGGPRRFFVAGGTSPRPLARGVSLWTPLCRALRAGRAAAGQALHPQLAALGCGGDWAFGGVMAGGGGVLTRRRWVGGLLLCARFSNPRYAGPTPHPWVLGCVGRAEVEAERPCLLTG